MKGEMENKSVEEIVNHITEEAKRRIEPSALTVKMFNVKANSALARGCLWGGLLWVIAAFLFYGDPDITDALINLILSRTG